MTEKIINKKFSLGIVGGGTIAKGLLKLFVKAGVRTVAVLRDEKKITMLKNELRGYQKEKFPARPLVDIKFARDLKELTGCSLIIEAIVEDFTPKVRLYRRLKKIIDKNTLIATTTSSLSINKLATVSGTSERFVGLHFFNPPQGIAFVEVIPSKRILPIFLKSATDFLKLINYDYVILSDTKGFVANKLLFSMLMSAVELRVRNKIGEGIIDSVVKKSLKHPMGPFELLNFIGIDTSDKIFANLFSGKKLSVWKEYYEALNR